MASVTLYTRSKIEKDSDIILGIGVRDTNINIRVSTGLKIPSHLWDARKAIIKSYGLQSTDLVERMDIVSTYLKTITEKVELFISKHNNIIGSDIKSIITEVLESKASIGIPSRMNDYIPFIIEQMKNGERKTPQGDNYAIGSIKPWNSFLKNWLEFQSECLGRTISFENIDMKIYHRFVDFFYEKGYRTKTIEKYLTLLIASLNYSLADKLHTNTIQTEQKFSKSVKDKTEGNKAYLTPDEITAIYNLELDDIMLDQVRDLFLIGYYCAQRVSDYSNITRDKIEIKGDRVFYHLYQQKTGNKTVVPILDKNAITILEKYDYNLPRMGNQESTATLINRHIKTICELAGITQDFTKEETIGGRIVKQTKPKCEFITSHTARRSAITNFYKSGVFTEAQIMLISGHTTHKAFSEYICLTKEEKADLVAEQYERAMNELNKVEKA